ncbi:MAG: hypothetical protein LBU87_01055 [Lactobacillales bacterium]|jgi:hypothetical protein|nr:hypothetical protein [Lactobacillales bacterium]
MLIAFTGLHATGKTYLTDCIHKKFGFDIYNKQEIIANICEKQTGRKDWYKWYHEKFRKDSTDITSQIARQLPFDRNIILDAIHNPIEWKIIQSIIPLAFLAVVITPKPIRSTRWDEGDHIKDIQRIKYWHSVYGNSTDCLLAHADWSFNGAASREINEKNFEELMKYAQSRNFICRQKSKLHNGLNIQRIQ